MEQGLLSAIIYIARKLHWSRKEIGALMPPQFREIVNEIQRQEAQEEYNKNYRTASILAAIYNTIPRKSRKVFSANDFLTGEKGEQRDNTDLEGLAAREGIIMPKYKKEE